MLGMNFTCVKCNVTVKILNTNNRIGMPTHCDDCLRGSSMRDLENDFEKSARCNSVLMSERGVNEFNNLQDLENNKEENKEINKEGKV